MEKKEFKWTDFTQEQKSCIIKQYQLWLETESDSVVERIAKAREARDLKGKAIEYALRHARDEQEKHEIMIRLIGGGAQYEHDRIILEDLSKKGLAPESEEFLSFCAKVDYSKPLETHA